MLKAGLQALFVQARQAGQFGRRPRLFAVLLQQGVFAAQALAGVERVELLKGPQGTLYGKSALGGVLNVHTRTPGDTPYFSLRGTLPERGGRAAQAEAAGAFVPGLLYGAALIGQDDVVGDVRSVVLAQDRLGSARAGLGRLRLRLAPQGRPWEASAWAARECTHGPQDVYVPFADIRPRQAYADARVRGEYRNYHMHRCGNSLAAQGQYDGRDWRLTATAGNQRVRFERRFPIGAYHSSQPERWQQNMQELRWATLGDGQAGSGRRWDAVLGLYRQRAQQQRSSQFTLATVPASMPATHSTGVSQTLAAYGDLTWHATPRMDGGAGASAFAGSAAQAHNTWQGRLNAGWQFSPQWRGYANLAQGYKPAGYNLAPSNPLDAQGFRRERAASYEVGARRGVTLEFSY